MDDREVKPWDFLNPKTKYASEEEADRRYSICKQCPFLLSGVNRCTKCGCFMVLKTKLADAFCPEHKW